MGDASSDGWRELRRPLQADCPKLFYNFMIQESGFDLLLTDLVAIWQCALNKDGIIRSADKQNTSIDPSESQSQFRVLLQRLNQSLKSERNRLYHDVDVQTQKVHLKTQIGLPGPLKPLTWIFALTPQPASELAEHLLRPCLFEASVSKRKIDSLHRVIREKDHVLSRILEKIESLSTDLSIIFPGITGLKPKRGRTSVTDAEKHVPGMKAFDPEEWLRHFQTDNLYAGYDQKGINNLTSGCEKCPKHTPEEHFDWLEGLPEKGEESTNTFNTPKTSTRKRKLRLSVNQDDSTASEDEFERQATPPSMQKRGEAASSFGIPSATSSKHETPPSLKRTKLGKLRGPNKERPNARQVSERLSSSPERFPMSLSMNSSRASVASTTSDTASDEDLDPTSPEVQTKKPKSEIIQSQLGSHRQLERPTINPQRELLSTPRHTSKLNNTSTSIPFVSTSQTPKDIHEYLTANNTGEKPIPISIPRTPTHHRLGKLGRRSQSQSQSRSRSQTASPSIKRFTDLNSIVESPDTQREDIVAKSPQKINEDEDTTPTPSPSPSSLPLLSLHNPPPSQSGPPNPNSNSDLNSQPQSLPQPPESPTSKANRLREQLKRKTSDMTTSGTAVTGGRKKRRF